MAPYFVISLANTANHSISPTKSPNFWCKDLIQVWIIPDSTHIWSCTLHVGHTASCRIPCILEEWEVCWGKE